MSLLFIVLTILVLLSILLLISRKAGLQLQYLRYQRKLKLGSVNDYWRFNWQDAKARQQRWEAFLLFPILYGVVVSDDDDAQSQTLKKAVKRTHILIYLAFIALLLLGVYSEKAFPAS
jgi:hypothetical protein